MSEPTLSPADAPNPETTASPVKKARSPLERVIVWGGIVVLLLVAGVEVMAQRGYYATVKKMEDLEKVAFSESNPRTATIASTAEGWYSQSPTPGAVRKTVRLKWPSLFKQYLLDVDLDSKDRVLSFVTVGDSALIGPMNYGPKPEASASSASPEKKGPEASKSAQPEPEKAQEPAAQPEKADAEEAKTDK